MARKAKTESSGLSPKDQIQQYLKDHKGDHYNFEEERDYTVSSGSLLLDIEMGGGIKPGIIRASGVSEGGKTSCALAFARNFQKMENSMVVYIKAEGRLTQEMIDRSGIDEDEDKWQIIKSHVYETVIDLIRQMVKDNPTDTRYMFIIDSMDALVPRGDLEKGADEALKVAGGSLLSSDFLRRMSLGLASRGHICYMISQVRSKVSINPYEKTDPRLTNASGGNAMLHYSDWILEFQPRWGKDAITSGPKGKEEILGHWCKIVFRKTANEKTGIEVKYPIKYRAEAGKSVWVEKEVADMMIAWDMAVAKGAWVTVSDEIIEEVKEKTGLEFKKQHQGVDNFGKYFGEEPKIGKYMFAKFREALKKQ